MATQVSAFLSEKRKVHYEELFFLQAVKCSHVRTVASCSRCKHNDDEDPAMQTQLYVWSQKTRPINVVVVFFIILNL